MKELKIEVKTAQTKNNCQFCESGLLTQINFQHIADVSCSGGAHTTVRENANAQKPVTEKKNTSFRFPTLDLNLPYKILKNVSDEDLFKVTRSPEQCEDLEKN